MWPECSCFRKCLIRIMAKFPQVEERLIFPPSVVVAFLVFILFCLIISRASLNGDNGSVCPLRGNAVQNITPVSLKRATERHSVDWLLLFEERDELEIMYKRVPGKRLALIWCSIYFFCLCSNVLHMAAGKMMFISVDLRILIQIISEAFRWTIIRSWLDQSPMYIFTPTAWH